ncbi:MAG: hypothetical protein H5U00_09830 [Clostridia bacterium]|nr:hypothetical protein [Clostridia bacterium]
MEIHNNFEEQIDVVLADHDFVYIGGHGAPAGLPWTSGDDGTGWVMRIWRRGSGTALSKLMVSRWHELRQRILPWLSRKRYLAVTV